MRRLAAGFLFLLLSQTAFAQSASALHGALTAEGKRLQVWGRDAVILDAVRRQNSVPATMDAIQRIDLQWVTGKHESLKKETTSNPCAERLRQLMIEGVHGEAFVTDQRGAVVCAARVTSDYWQGDEPKFTNAFKDGRGAVFIDRPRYDESVKANVAHISVPVMDGVRAIGVLVVGVKADKMARK
jgi:hypothetical protein